MLVFVDESEWPRPKDPDGFTVWAAIAIPPRRGREFFREIYRLEEKFWKVTEPYEFEIKGRLLLNKTAVTSPKKREFCEEIVSLCKLSGVKAFAVGLKNPDTLPLGNLTEPIVYRVYSRLLERVNAMMVENGATIWPSWPLIPRTKKRTRNGPGPSATSCTGTQSAGR